MATSFPDEIMQDFAAELKTYVPRLKDLMDDLSPSEGWYGKAEKIRQLVRSIKGAATMMGVSNLGQIASEWEGVLNSLLQGRLVFNAELENEMIKALEAMEVFAEGLSSGDFEDAKPAQSTVEGLSDPQSAAVGSRRHEKTDSVRNEHSPGAVRKSGKIDECSNQPAYSELDAFLNDADGAGDADEMDMEEMFASIESELEADVDSMKNDLLEGFYQEAEEHLQNLEKGLQVLEFEILEPGAITSSQREQLRRIRRSVHTLKGAASIVGVQKPAAWAHEVEDFLDWLYDTASDISPEILVVLARAADLLNEYVNRTEPSKPEMEQELRGRFAELMETVPGAKFCDSDDNARLCRTLDVCFETDSPLVEEAASETDFDKGVCISSPSRMMRVKLDRIDSLANLAGELAITLSAFDQRMKHLNFAIQELSLTRHRLREAARDLELGYEIKAIRCLDSIAAHAAHDADGVAAWPHPTMEFDTLEMDRYSEFNLIIRAINETAVDIGALNADLSTLGSDFAGFINRQRNLLGELQTDITRVRMSPMTIIAGRLRRTVRETSDRLGKQVRLTIEGEEIELDRTVWEKLADPLMHMLRNAIDHGIESPAERLAAGKPETGAIAIHAAYVGQHVSIRISDDGRGLDYETIRKRMRAAGKMAHGRQAPREELAAFVFHQGFSTRRRVTEISGRGVGLDVVRENIGALQGTVRVAGSEPGQGTRFDILIPLTVGMLRAVLFTVGDCVYAVPLREVREIVRLDARHWIHEPSPAIRLAGEIVPFYRLAELLRQDDAAPAQASMADNPVVMVVDNGAWRGAVAVDSLIGQREIVVKNTGTHLRNVRGVFGATISGDGMVVPILNLAELLEAGAEDWTPPPMETVSISRAPLDFLVVDDSVSVRQVIARLLGSKGWNADTARDGVEALEKLANVRPDLIILDLEMPRMNGYEFLSTLQARKEYRDIPVVMVTSRAAEKHRRKALGLGAREYVAKPFDHDKLLGLVERLATEAKPSMAWSGQ